MRAAVALLLLSCASVVEAPIAPARCWSWDPTGLAPEDVAVLEDAAARWSSVTREPVTIGKGCRVVLAPQPQGTVGEYRDGVMYLRPDAVFTSVVMHEMGHGLGLKHTDAGGVMAPIPWGTMTASDVEECRRAGAC